MYIYKNWKSKSILLSTFLLALFADIKSMNTIFTSVGISEDSSIMSVMYIFIIGIFLLISFFKGREIINHINRYYFFSICYVLISFFLSSIFLGTPYTKFHHLLVFTVAALFIPYIVDVNIRLCLKIMMILPIIGIPYLNKMFVFINEYVEWVSMGTSYAFMPPILANILYLVVYFKNETKKQKVLTILASISNLIYLFYLFQYGSRGPLVCMIGLLIFLFVVKKPNDSPVFINKKNLILVIFVSICIIVFFIPFMTICSELLSSIGINSHFVDKMINLDSGGNLSNGRDVIAEITYQGILENPLFGNGFDQFSNNTGYVYPHNVILQILYDGGLFLFCIIILPVIKKIKLRFNNCTNDEFVLLTFFLFAGVPGSMLSGDAWRQPLMWMFVGFVMSRSVVNE